MSVTEADYKKASTVTTITWVTIGFIPYTVESLSIVHGGIRGLLLPTNFLPTKV